MMFATIDFPKDILFKHLLSITILVLFVIFCQQPVYAEPYQRLETNHFFIDYSEVDGKLAKHIATSSENLRGRIIADIGYDFSDKTMIILAPSIEEFQKVQPGKEMMPLWAVAVAYPRRNLIILRSPGAVEGGRLDYEKVFTHEFTHIVFGKVLEGRETPTWLAEGFAMYVSSEWHLARMTSLTKAFLMKRVIPLEQLTANFPSDPEEAELAYAESFMFVSFLINKFGRKSFQQLLRNYAADGDLSGSLTKITGMHLVTLEKEWFDYMKARVSWIPLITSATSFWFVITLIFIYGYFRKRRITRKILQEWEEEERENNAPP
ncbi:MAG: peptidase MA family metallohydrolase [Syntrophaceae bacterium]